MSAQCSVRCASHATLTTRKPPSQPPERAPKYINTPQPSLAALQQRPSSTTAPKTAPAAPHWVRSPENRELCRHLGAGWSLGARRPEKQQQRAWCPGFVQDTGPGACQASLPIVGCVLRQPGALTCRSQRAQPAAGAAERREIAAEHALIGRFPTSQRRLAFASSVTAPAQGCGWPRCPDRSPFGRAVQAPEVSCGRFRAPAAPLQLIAALSDRPGYREWYRRRSIPVLRHSTDFIYSKFNAAPPRPEPALAGPRRLPSSSEGREFEERLKLLSRPIFSSKKY